MREKHTSLFGSAAQRPNEGTYKRFELCCPHVPGSTSLNTVHLHFSSLIRQFRERRGAMHRPFAPAEAELGAPTGQGRLRLRLGYEPGTISRFHASSVQAGERDVS